jgi:calcineurin-like phosphoesterase family protein
MWAILSGIQGNLPAYQAVLEDIQQRSVTVENLYILGDFSLSPKAVMEFAHKLNGKKHLICGNHDAPFDFTKKRKAEHMRKRYLENFVTVQMQGELVLKNGVKVLLKHFPYSLEFDQRYREHRPKDEGEWLLHGHLHCAYVKKDKQIDVGIDHNFKLYTEDDIISLMNDERTFIPSRLTGIRKNRADGDSY